MALLNAYRCVSNEALPQYGNFEQIMLFGGCKQNVKPHNGRLLIDGRANGFFVAFDVSQTLHKFAKPFELAARNIGSMKVVLPLTMILAVSPLLFAQKMFEGEIMDKQCAQMGSHENMMAAEHATTAEQCALACAKNGDSFALLDPSTKKLYVIEDGKKVKDYAGRRVTITGKYDQDDEVLHVKTISVAK